MSTQGPIELRVKWIHDDVEPDPGTGTDEEIAEFWRYVELYGVYGCVIETRPPACACCGVKVWSHAESLWGIVGDLNYHAETERELMAEVAYS